MILAEHFVKCDPSEGLTQAEADHAIQVLKGAVGRGRMGELHMQAAKAAFDFIFQDLPHHKAYDLSAAGAQGTKVSEELDLCFD